MSEAEHERVDQADEALRESEANYRDLVEHATYGIYRSSPDGRFLSVNRALVEMLKYESQDELLSVDMAKDVYADPEERDRLIERQTGRPRFDRIEVTWKCKDGTPITVSLSGRPVRNEVGKVESFETIAENVTERWVLEAQLRQAQKMEAVGQLTGGVAHDFNNLLTVILGNAYLVADSLTPDQSDTRADLKELQAAAERAKELTSKLLGFGRREMLALKPTNLQDVVEGVSNMLRRVVPENIEMEFLSEEPTGTVQADGGAVEQILLNLVTNSRDAMPKGGELRIELRQTLLDEGYALTHPWVVLGEFVCLSVSDTGVGMDKRTIEKVFEPFFTTKPRGAGTGLGMAMVYGLVKQHGGFVHVYSEVGQGTTIKVYFPVVQEHSIAAVGHRSPAEARGGAETILVVEDESSIRRSAKRVLEKNGYSVLIAADGEDALEQFRSHEHEINLVITDLVMPKLGGRELHDALTREDKDIKFMFTSGYNASDAEDRVGLEPDVPFLHKPWTVADLLSSVREVLDQEQVR